MNNPILIIFIILFCIVSGYMMLSYNSPEPESVVNKVAAQSKTIDEEKAAEAALDNKTVAPPIENNNVDLNIKNIEGFKVEEQKKCTESQKQAGLTEEYAGLWCTCMVEAVISKFGANEYINVIRDESRFSDFALKCQNSVLLDTRGPETPADK